MIPVLKGLVKYQLMSTLGHLESEYQPTAVAWAPSPRLDQHIHHRPRYSSVSVKLGNTLIKQMIIFALLYFQLPLYFLNLTQFKNKIRCQRIIWYDILYIAVCITFLNTILPCLIFFLRALLVQRVFIYQLYQRRWIESNCSSLCNK